MLSVASRRIRTSMWSALQSTNLFATNVALASGEEPPEDEFALKAKNDEDEDEDGEGSDDGYGESAEQDTKSKTEMNNCDNKANKVDPLGGESTEKNSQEVAGAKKDQGNEFEALSATIDRDHVGLGGK